jgi:endonuclease YncB( thermonuclease family)
VALISLDGESVNRLMVAAGYAWVYTRYCRAADICQPLEELKAAAWEERRGL